MTRQPVAHRTRGHGEMGIDDIEGCLAHQGFAPPDRRRHVGKERRQAAGRLFGAAVDRNADDARTVLMALFRKIEGFRRQDGDVMPFGEFVDQLRRDHAPAAAKRRIFVIADEDVHIGVIRQIPRLSAKPLMHRHI